MKLNKVVIVDDEKFVLKILIDSLTNIADKIITASDGKEGLKRILEEQPDIIISDVMMPKMNGLELLKAVRVNTKTENIPFLLLTVKDKTKDIINGYDHGADYYLPKPFELEQLIRGIETAISVRSEGVEE